MGHQQTTPAACLACRSKHVKCDGTHPCTRCKSSGRQCSYVASRRGCRPIRPDTAPYQNKRRAATSPLGRERLVHSPVQIPDGLQYPGEDFLSPAVTASASLDSHQGDSMSALMNMQMFDLFGDAGAPNNSLVSGSSQTSTHGSRARSPSYAVEERCFEAFYFYFFSSQPFVLPREAFLQLSKKRDMSVVLAAMCWIGSLFTELNSGVRDRAFEDAMAKATDTQAPRDGFLLQAIMLLIIGLDGQGDQKRARDLLAEARSLALQIKLNGRPFARMQSRGDPTLAESWRRTWWNLYVTDAMVSGVHRITNFALFDVPSDVELPCEDEDYTSNNIPQPLTLQDVLDDEFADSGHTLSSFAYRILSCRNLGHFMRTPPIITADDANIARLEARLTNWRLHLPPSKRSALQKDGSVDEMMFQAHMMMHATSILLHQPHARLDTTPTEDINSCAPHPGAGRVFQESFNTHTQQTVAAASAISDLITLRSPLTQRTHFFSCVITLSSIVHLSRWALYGCNNEELRQQIRLNIGGLKELSQVWVTAATARAQVMATARDMFKAKQQQQQLFLDASFSTDFLLDDMHHQTTSDNLMLEEDDMLKVPQDLTTNTE